MRMMTLLLCVSAACYTDAEVVETDQVSQELVSDQIPEVYSKYYRVMDRYFRNIDITSSNDAVGNPTYHGGINQRFMIIPTAPDSNQFYIASKYRGGVIDAAGNNNLYMADAYPHGGSNQRFVFGGAVGNFYGISTIHKYGTFDIAGGGGTRDLYVGSPHGGYNQQFTFIPVENFPYATPQPFEGPAPGMIGDVPRITSYSSTPPEISTPVKIGVAAIPYIYVRGDNSRSYQVQYTPYYELTREQYWKRVELKEKPVDASQSEQYTVTYGMSQTQSLEVQSTFQFTLKLTGESSFSDEGLKVTLGSSLEQQLKVVTTYSSTVSHTQQYQMTFNLSFPVGKRVRWAAWHLVDSYTLRRMDKSLVKSWNLVYLNTKIIDAYSE